MATDIDQPTDDANAEGDIESDLSVQQLIQLTREVDAIEREAENLAQFQKFIRVKSSWDDKVAEEFHDELLGFIEAQFDDHDELSVLEVTVSLWDELTRIEHKLRKPDDADGEGSAATESEAKRAPQRRSGDDADGTAGALEPEHDPTFL